MVEILRNKWCEDLEELLQCPICMMRPRAAIHLCVRGHHVCEDCKKQLPVCPTCNKNWCVARNRLAESLSSILDDIKLSLIDPEAEINKLSIPNRESVATQTDADIAAHIADVPAVSSPKKSVLLLADRHAGTYPCHIGTCRITLSFAAMIKHIKAYHAMHYFEFPPVLKSSFRDIWTFKYTTEMTLDRAIHIAEMGTFFVKLSSDVFGNFKGIVLMLHNGFISKQFTYQLEISCCEEHKDLVYTGEVCSCRTPLGAFKDKSLQASRSEMCRLTTHKDPLKCTFLLSINPQTSATAQTMTNNNEEKKIYPKNRNHGAENGKDGPSQLGGQITINNGTSKHQPRPRRPHRPSQLTQPAPNGQASTWGEPPPLFRSEYSADYEYDYYDYDL